MIISQREGIKTTIKSCYLYVEEINLSDEDKIKYLRMLNNGYMQNINFLENHTTTFNDKMNEINEKFNINNVQNGESIFIYGILDANKEGKHYDLPSVEFKKPYLNIDNIRFENLIPNDMSAYEALKYKSNHYDNFLISYDNFRKYYKIYCWNISREIRNNKNNKFINIITDLGSTSCTVYAVFRTFSTVKLEYSKNNGLSIYRSQ